MRKFCVIGRNGFIGKALTKRLETMGTVASYPTPDTEILYYFGSTTHPDFEMNPDYHTNKVLQDFLFLLPYCKRHGIRFIYASSALVYEKDITFTKCKRMLETLAMAYPRTLGLRIFPVYGPGENKTVIMQWCAQMKKGLTPKVFGTGEQKRDFIFIEDVIDQIILLTEMNAEGIMDVGAGKLTSFNAIISAINLNLGTKIQPDYIEAPKDYSEGIYCKLPLPTKHSIEDAIKIILEQ